MNIMFLDSINKDIYGGMEEWIRLVSGGLAQRGHNVSVCGRTDSEFLRRFSKQKNLSQIPLAISGDFNPVTIARIKKEIESRKIEILVTNFNKDIRLGGLAAKLEGSPKVIWSAGLDITKDSLVHRKLTPRLIDSVIVPSKALGAQINKFGYIDPAIIDVIPIGIPELSPKPDRIKSRSDILKEFNLPENTIIAVTSGRFVEQKGHRYLLSSAGKILQKHPNIYFLLLGSGELENELRETAKSDILSGHILFAGMRDNVNTILAGCDLMIHPSIEEPFGIAILEGMRAGLPVVASHVGGIPEVVTKDETAVLVPPRDQNLLAGAVNRLLDNPGRMKSLGENGKMRWHQVFSESLMIDRVERHFTKVLNKKGVHGSA